MGPPEPQWAAAAVGPGEDIDWVRIQRLGKNRKDRKTEHQQTKQSPKYFGLNKATKD